MQIEGTEAQSKSENWHSERWCRLTASTCLQAYKIGQKVATGDNNAGMSAKKFIAEKIWKLEDNNVQTTWMAYGLQSEAAAINKYQLQTSHVVSPSGLWVNPDFPYLACTPDGLIGDDGVLEIKSLKLFKEHSINDVINDNGTLIPKETVKRQCFTIEDNKCVLKKTHSYYYQVQLQLLVTDRSFCDFVLYAENGPVNIERIYRDNVLINDILIALTALWQRVIAPELFEMRVPRDLDPFIMAKDFLTSNLPATCTPDNSSRPLTPDNSSLPSTSTPNSSSLPSTRDTSSLPSTQDTSRLPSTQDTSRLPSPGDSNHTTDEIHIASFLATCASYIPVVNQPTVNLKVIPWGGTTRFGVKLVNTCPVDNWLMILQSLVKSGRINLSTLGSVGDKIKLVLDLIDLELYGDAKIAILPDTPVVNNGVMDLYGNESDYVIKLLQPFLTTEVTSMCNLNTCPSKINTYKSNGIELGSNSDMLSSLDEWLHPKVTNCQRKFKSMPPPTIPSQTDVTLNCDGTQSTSWHCSGSRESTSRSFSCFKNFFVLSVDFLSRRNHLKFKDVPACIYLNGKQLHLHSATLWNGSHYICIFSYDNTWLIYDGFKEYNQVKTGLAVFTGQPIAYSLSHIVYIE